MAYLTRAEAILSYRRTYGTVTAAADRQLREEVAKHSALSNYDIFLSHCSRDRQEVLGVHALLKAQGLKVFVDWIEDPLTNRAKVTSVNAAWLRQVMRASKTFVYLVSDNSESSKWMAWELGYFDGFRPGHIGILPLVDDIGAGFAGVEFVGLYPTVQRESLGAAGTQWVAKSRNGFATLGRFITEGIGN